MFIAAAITDWLDGYLARLVRPAKWLSPSMCNTAVLRCLLVARPEAS